MKYSLKTSSKVLEFSLIPKNLLLINFDRHGIKKKNNLARRDFIKNSAAISAGVMILPHHILNGKANKPPNDKGNIGSSGNDGQTDNNKKSISFLNKPYPVIAGII
jgi:hypothetical protein